MLNSRHEKNITLISKISVHTEFFYYFNNIKHLNIGTNLVENDNGKIQQRCSGE